MHSFVQFPATFFRFQISDCAQLAKCGGFVVPQAKQLLETRSWSAAARPPGPEVAMPVETMEWPARVAHAAIAMTPSCEKCGGSLAFVGKLPAIRLLPLLQVYKCSPCNHVITVRP